MRTLLDPPERPEFKPASALTPRPYQTAGVEAVYRELAGKDSTLLGLPTGCGKTVVFGLVAGRWLQEERPGDVLVLAHREELIFQARDELAPLVGFQPAVEMAELRASRNSRVVVASVQSLWRPDRLREFDPGRFGLVVIDECFPAGTLVDGRPIEEIRKGDTVTAVSMVSGAAVPRKVIHKFESKAPSRLIRLTVHGRTVVCTPNHPFMTESSGWVSAGLLTVGEYVVLRDRREVFMVREGIRAGLLAGEGVQPEGDGLLCEDVQLGLPLEGVERSHGPDEPAVRFRPDEGEQPDGPPGIAGEDGEHAEGDRAPAAGPRRKRPTDAGAGSATVGGVGLAVRGGGADAGSPGERLPDVLQVGHRQPGPADRDRSGRSFARHGHKEDAGPEEGPVFAVARVDRVEVLEPGSDGTFGGVCPDGRVYNLEVETDHTYIANGFVVHNCHHCVPQAKTYWSILEYFKAAKRLGVTATARRGDGLALGQAFESVAYSMGIEEAVGDGWLVPVRQQFVTVADVDLSPVGTVAGDLNQGHLSAVMNAPEVVKRIAAATVEHCGSEPTLVFTVDVEQAEQIADVLNAIRSGSAVALSGKTPGDDRRRYLAAYARGEFQYLVGCALFTEGFNEPRISRVVMARPTKSIVYYTQAVGRGTRTLRGVLTPEMETADERRRAIAASGKPDLLVLDFVGNSGRHKLVSCVDIFAGETRRAAGERARNKAEKSGKPIEVSSALTAAEEEITRADRKRAERSAARVAARVTYTARDVDPFGNTDGADRGAVRRDGAAPATAGQLDYIKKGGGFVRDGMTAGEAGKEVADVNRRRREGLCSRRQEHTLKKHGLGPTDRASAKALLDLLAARGWYRLGYELTADRLGLRQVGGGWRLVVNDPTAGKVPVGAVYATPGDVRAAYRGLCREPAAV